MNPINTLNSVLLHPNSCCGTDLETWLNSGGGKGLETALHDSTALIPIIKEADLRGLGGSGFPTYKKWERIASQPNEGERYLVCNGNEDEPGTFKDRTLLEDAPHQVIEGALITALAVAINNIIFYIHPKQKKSLENIRQAVMLWQKSRYIKAIEKKLGCPLTIRIMTSSGHYVDGEETAAIESIEGKFPFPRGKPPFPTQQGINNKPTLVNNIETLANIPHIIRHGAPWYRNLGLGQASGTKLYSLSGDVLSPGVYELPMGVPLDTLIFNVGGGILGSKKLKAVFTGGPSNTLFTAKDLDVPLDFDSVAQRQASLGTGTIIVIAEGNSIVKRVTEYINFFALSSCGQCPPCKIGTYHISLLLTKFNNGHAEREDLETLIHLSKILPDSGRCHLPNGVAKVLESTLYYFMDEYEKNIKSNKLTRKNG
ncbi:MAG: NADH-quinone oxidoreductase subunit F [Gammaproteobacteria bacterium]|nr:NADH-quinone oxidoreductase subunit F [Gammaproteobacteria bacterium]